MARLQLIMFGVALLVGACQDQPRPWDGKPQAGVQRSGGKPFLPKTASAKVGAIGSSARPSVGEIDLWSSCHQGFHGSANAHADAVRLGLICGPVTGMRKLGNTHVGQLSEEHPQGRVRFNAERGACYRVFGAATRKPGDTLDLDLALLSSRGSRLAKDEMTDSWAVLHANKALCTFANEPFEVHIEVDDEALEDTPRWAIEIWRLPPSQ